MNYKMLARKEQPELGRKTTPKARKHVSYQYQHPHQIALDSQGWWLLTVEALCLLHMAQYVPQHPGSGRVPEPQSQTVMRQDLGTKPKEIKYHPTISCTRQGAVPQQNKVKLSASHQSPAPKIFQNKIKNKALKGKVKMCNEAKVTCYKTSQALNMVDYVYFLKIYTNHTHTLNNSMYFQPHKAQIPKISDNKRGACAQTSDQEEESV